MMCRIFGNLNVCWIYVTNWSTHLTPETGFFGVSTTVTNVVAKTRFLAYASKQKKPSSFADLLSIPLHNPYISA